MHSRTGAPHDAIPGIVLRAKVKPSSARNKMAVERHDRVEHMSHSLPLRARPDPAAAPFLQHQLQLASSVREKDPLAAPSGASRSRRGNGNGNINGNSNGNGNGTDAARGRRAFLADRSRDSGAFHSDTQADDLISSYAALTRDLDGLCRGRLGAGVGIKSLDRPQLKLGAAPQSQSQSRRGRGGAAKQSIRQRGEDFLRRRGNAVVRQAEAQAQADADALAAAAAAAATAATATKQHSVGAGSQQLAQGEDKVTSDALDVHLTYHGHNQGQQQVESAGTTNLCISTLTPRTRRRFAALPPPTEEDDVRLRELEARFGIPLRDAAHIVADCGGEGIDNTEGSGAGSGSGADGATSEAGAFAASTGNASVPGQSQQLELEMYTSLTAVGAATKDTDGGIATEESELVPRGTSEAKSRHRRRRGRGQTGRAQARRDGRKDSTDLGWSLGRALLEHGTGEHIDQRRSRVVPTLPGVSDDEEGDNGGDMATVFGPPLQRDYAPTALADGRAARRARRASSDKRAADALCASEASDIIPAGHAAPKVPNFVEAVSLNCIVANSTADASLRAAARQGERTVTDIEETTGAQWEQHIEAAKAATHAQRRAARRAGAAKLAALHALESTLSAARADLPREALRKYNLAGVAEERGARILAAVASRFAHRLAGRAMRRWSAAAVALGAGVQLAYAVRLQYWWLAVSAGRFVEQKRALSYRASAAHAAQRQKRITARHAAAARLQRAWRCLRARRTLDSVRVRHKSAGRLTAWLRGIAEFNALYGRSKASAASGSSRPGSASCPSDNAPRGKLALMKLQVISATKIEAVWRGHVVRRRRRLVRRIKLAAMREKHRRQHVQEVIEKLQRDGAALAIQHSYRSYNRRLANIKRANMRAMRQREALRSHLRMLVMRRRFRKYVASRQVDTSVLEKAAVPIQAVARRRLALKLVSRMKRERRERRKRLRAQHHKATHDKVYHIPLPKVLAKALKLYRLKQMQLLQAAKDKKKKNKRLQLEQRRKKFGEEEGDKKLTADEESELAARKMKRQMQERRASVKSGQTLRRASAVSRAEKYNLAGDDKVSAFGGRKRDSKWANVEGQDRGAARIKLAEERARLKEEREGKEKAAAEETEEERAAREQREALEKVSGTLDINVTAMFREWHHLKRACIGKQLVKRHRAATAFQRLYRGHRGRRRVRYYRGHEGEQLRRKRNRAKKRHARTIQKVYRGHLGRVRAHNLRRYLASTDISRVYRGVRGRRFFARYSAQHALVTCVQKVARGMVTRQRLRRKRAKRLRDDAAALIIQKPARRRARRALSERALLHKRWIAECKQLATSKQNSIITRRVKLLVVAQMRQKEIYHEPGGTGMGGFDKLTTAKGKAEKVEHAKKGDNEKGGSDRPASPARSPKDGSKSKAARKILGRDSRTDNDLAHLFHLWAGEVDPFHLQGVKWQKMLADAPGLLTRTVNETFVDLVFAKYAGRENRLDFTHWIVALRAIGAKRFPNPNANPAQEGGRRRTFRKSMAAADSDSTQNSNGNAKDGAKEESGTEAEDEFADDPNDPFVYAGYRGSDGRVLRLVQEHLLQKGSDKSKNAKVRKRLHQHATRVLSMYAMRIQARLRGIRGRQRARDAAKRRAAQRRHARRDDAARVIQRGWRCHAARTFVVRRLQRTVRKYRDPALGLPYWFNPNSRTVSWTKPTLFGSYDCAVMWETPDEWTAFTIRCANCAPHASASETLAQRAAAALAEEADVEVNPGAVAAGGRFATKLCNTLGEAYCDECWDAVHRKGARATFTATPIFVCEDCGEQAATKREWTKGVKRDRCDVCMANVRADPTYRANAHRVDPLVCECETVPGCPFAARWRDCTTGRLSCHRHLNVEHNKGDGQYHEVEYLPYLTPHMREQEARRAKEEAMKLKLEELRRAERAARQQRRTDAAVYIQSHYRGRRFGREGRWLLKCGRLQQRKAWRQRKLRDDPIRRGMLYRLLDSRFGHAIGLSAPALPSDTLEFRLTRQLPPGRRRLQALDYLNGNITFDQPDDPKKKRIKGLRIGTEEELVVQARLGGSRMPGTVKLTEGSNVIHTSVDLTSVLERGERVRFGDCPLIFVIKTEETAEFSGQKFIVDRKWLEASTEAAFIFKLEQLEGFGKLRDRIARDMEANQQFQQYLNVSSKVYGAIGKRFDKFARAWGGEDHAGCVGGALGKIGDRYLRKSRRNANRMIFERRLEKDDLSQKEHKEMQQKQMDNVAAKKAARKKAAYMDEEGEAERASGLPKGWEEKDDGTGKKYFYNTETGESTWDRPADEVKQKGTNVEYDASVKRREEMARKKKGATFSPKKKKAKGF